MTAAFRKLIRYFFGILLLAILYFISGKLGLYLAIPPVILPSFGRHPGWQLASLFLAVGACGRNIIGSFILNCTVAGNYYS